MDRIALFQERLATKPDDRFARYSLALELKKAGRAAEALDTFAELLRRHPASGAGHYQRGLLLQELGRDEEAIAAWEEGLVRLAGVEEAEARRSVREIEAALASA